VQPPVPRQVQAEIAALEAVKAKVPQYNGFGEDNHTAIDAQVWVLTERADNDQIYDAYGEDVEEFRPLLDAALDALHWMEGDEPPPSVGWQELT